jgi:hypothetical protein
MTRKNNIIDWQKLNEKVDEDIEQEVKDYLVEIKSVDMILT